MNFISFKDFIRYILNEEEKLKFSEAKKYIGYSQDKYKTLRNDVFKDKHRIYIPVEVPEDAIKNNPIAKEIKKYIENRLGSPIDAKDFDYMKGLVKKDKQVYKIGRLLTDNSDILSEFSEDPLRGNNKLLIVISRHPYDIAAMSTDRKWPSCMNIRGDGSQKKYVKCDVEEGTLIAYLISAKDTDIENPLARVLLKPYKHKKLDDTIYHVSKIYGLKNEYFKQTVEKWADENLNSPARGYFFYRNPQLYGDGEPEKLTSKFYTGDIVDIHKNKRSYLRGKLHNEFFPAVEKKDGTTEYWLDDKKMTKDKWETEMRKRVENWDDRRKAEIEKIKK